MDFLIPAAHAADGAAPADPGLMGFLPLIILFVVFYFLLIRPQSKRVKEHKKMVSELRKGDEVVTNGGLLGRVAAVGENFVTVEVADNVQLRVQKDMIMNLMPKGTIKNL